jgi:carboxyl-terminal processing protease
MKKLLRTISLRLIPVVSLLLLTACGGSGNPVGRWSSKGGDCLTNVGKKEVLDIMQDWYLWNDEADQFNKYRNLDLGDFGDAEELLDFLRYRPFEFDRGFSYITTPEEEQAFFGEGQFIGFGFSMVLVDNAIRFSQVFDGSPADAAGFQRGYRLVAINGRDISTFPSGEEFVAAFGPEEVGFSVTSRLRTTREQNCRRSA